MRGPRAKVGYTPCSNGGVGVESGRGVLGQAQQRQRQGRRGVQRQPHGLGHPCTPGAAGAEEGHRKEERARVGAEVGAKASAETRETRQRCRDSVCAGKGAWCTHGTGAAPVYGVMGGCGGSWNRHPLSPSSGHREEFLSTSSHQFRAFPSPRTLCVHQLSCSCSSELRGNSAELLRNDTGTAQRFLGTTLDHSKDVCRTEYIHA